MKKYMKILGAIGCFIALAVFLLNGCAAILKGSSEDVDFNSDPTGASVYVNGNLMGTTPVRLKLESKRTYNIEFKKDGYASRTYTITNHVGAGWIILDVLLTGLIGIVVDAATGAWYELDQDNVNAVLEKQQ